MVLGVDTAIQIDPDVLVDVHAHSKRQGGVCGIVNANHHHPFRRDEHLPMALKNICSRLVQLCFPQICLQPQVNREQPRVYVQVMPEIFHLTGLQIWPVTAGQVKREMTMRFLVPPILIRKVRQVLEPPIGGNRYCSRFGKSIWADPHDRSPEP